VRRTEQHRGDDHPERDAVTVPDAAVEDPTEVELLGDRRQHERQEHRERLRVRRQVPRDLFGWDDAFPEQQSEQGEERHADREGDDAVEDQTAHGSDHSVPKALAPERDPDPTRPVTSAPSEPHEHHGEEGRVGRDRSGDLRETLDRLAYADPHRGEDHSADDELGDH
jgi:hypothetical protein